MHINREMKFNRNKKKKNWLQRLFEKIDRFLNCHLTITLNNSDERVNFRRYDVNVLDFRLGAVAVIVCVNAAVLVLSCYSLATRFVEIGCMRTFILVVVRMR